MRDRNNKLLLNHLFNVVNKQLDEVNKDFIPCESDHLVKHKDTSYKSIKRKMNFICNKM